MAKQINIDIPFNFTPRSYQLPLCQCLENGYKRGVSVWHRRAGKDKTLINIMVKEACKRKGSYFYFFPTYSQGRKILWDGMDRDGFKFLDHIPNEIRQSTNGQEMKITLVNGSIIQVVGTDRIDSVVGTNPIGCVFSEYAIQRAEGWDFIRPILRENGGWALFNYTPRGLNHGYDMFQNSINSPEWFSECLTVDDTKRPDGSPVITEADIEQERNDGMSESMILQEFYCDFVASQENALISMVTVEEAAKRVYDQMAYINSNRILGVDCAEGGINGDKSTIIRRQGLYAFNLQTFGVLSETNHLMQFVGMITQEISDFDPDAVFIDAVGLGAGVVHRLNQLGFEDIIIPVKAGSSSSDKTRWFNLRAEMWDKCRHWLSETGGVIPNDRDLKRELSSQMFSYDGNNAIKLWAKEKMRDKYGVSSPDKAEALVHTFAYPVHNKRDEAFDIIMPRRQYYNEGKREHGVL